jgi:hypothetical protein
MITEKKPKLSVVEHLQDEHGYRVIKRPADDAETLFRRLHKQVTNTDTTIPRDAVEKCFRAAGYRRHPTQEAIDEATRKPQILADLSCRNIVPSMRENVVRAARPFVRALKERRDEWIFWRSVRPLRNSEAVDAGEIDDVLRLIENITERYTDDDVAQATNDFEQRVVHVAMIGRKAWESVGKAPLDATNPETSHLTKFTVAAMALLGDPRRPKKDEKRAKPNARSAEGAVAYVLRKHKRRLFF